jgi:hypothetical protein
MLSSVLLLLLLLFMFTFTQATWGGTEAAPAAPRTTAPAACTLTHDFGVSHAFQAREEVLAKHY